MGFFKTKKTRESQTILLRPRRSRLFRGVTRERQKSPAQHQRRTWSLWMVGYAFLWASFVGLVIFVLFFSSFLRIEQKDISPVEFVSKGDITEVIDVALSGKLFGILPNDTLLISFMRRHSVERKLLETFPMFRNVTISFLFPATIVLKIEERNTRLVLCSGGPCFFVDERGIAFDAAPAPHNQDMTGMLTVVDMSAKSVSWQDTLFSKDFLQIFPSLRQKLHDELGLEIFSVAETPSRFSDELWFQSTDGWELRMSAMVPLEKSIRALRLLFAKTLSEGDRKNLDYIDLRTENRIFYFLNGDEQKGNVLSSDTESVTESKNKKKK